MRGTYISVPGRYGSVPRATVSDGNRAAACVQIWEIMYGRCLWIFAAKNTGKMCSTPIFGKQQTTNSNQQTTCNNLQQQATTTSNNAVPGVVAHLHVVLFQVKQQTTTNNNKQQQPVLSRAN